VRPFLFGLVLLFVSCGEGAAAPPKRPDAPSAPALAREAPEYDGNSLAPLERRHASGFAGAPSIPDGQDQTLHQPRQPVASVALAEAAAMDESLLSLPVGQLEGASHLARLFGLFAQLDDGGATGDVRIMQYGDSHTACDLGVGVFRRALQARFGDGGRGFVPIGVPWKFYGQDGVRGGMTREFEPVRHNFVPSYAATKADAFGLLGVALEATRPGGRVWVDEAAPTSRIEIAYLTRPRGGSFDVLVDGALAGRVATRAAEAQSGYYAIEVPEAPHEIEVHTVGDGDVRIFGVTLDRAQAGAVVDTLGINGAQISTLLRWNEENFTEQLRHAAPDLVVLAYGTNEALDPGLSLDDYEPKLHEVIRRVTRAVPNTACLLLGPPDLARHTKGQEDWKTWPGVVEIVAVQRRVAHAAGCAFYDQMAAMGGPGSIMAWAVEPEPRARRDRVHLAPSGYAQLAMAFTTDLMRAYDEWRAAKGLPPTLASKTWGVATR
jgi:lysophospholipase L1-like esterase